MRPPEISWSAESSQRFADHEDHIRGYVRYEVTRQNLIATLGDFLKSPRRVIDIGGGQGSDARWVASLHAENQVVLVEPDASSVTEAKAKNDGLIQITQGDSAAALRRFAEQSFDLLLSHGVLMYVKEPQAELNSLAKLVRPGGYISLLNAGLLGKLDRYQRKGDQQVVDRLRLSGYFTNNMNLRARAFLPQEMERMIQAAGFSTIDWFGVRVKSDDDNRATEEVPVFHRNRILDEEIRLSRDKTTRPRGQMLHYIARKNT